MFKRIECIKWSDSIVHYLLVDDDFRHEVSAITHGGMSRAISAILKTYKERNLSIAPNIVQYYRTMYRDGYDVALIIDRDIVWTNEYCPEFQFEQQILPCVVRLIKQKSFGKKSGITKFFP